MLPTDITSVPGEKVTSGPAGRPQGCVLPPDADDGRLAGNALVGNPVVILQLA